MHFINQKIKLHYKNTINRKRFLKISQLKTKNKIEHENIPYK